MREKEYFSGCSQHPQRGCDLPDYVPYVTRLRPAKPGRGIVKIPVVI